MADLGEVFRLQNVPQDRLKPVGPFQNTGRAGDQVVADLQQRMRKAALGP
jgi:hypothetical protein